MPVISGKRAFLELLKQEGVEVLFGNPGTTELPLMDAFAVENDIRYVLGLQESVVMAMADGYAQASGKLAVVNLHVTPGLDGVSRAVNEAERGLLPAEATIVVGQPCAVDPGRAPAAKPQRSASPARAENPAGCARIVGTWKYPFQTVTFTAAGTSQTSQGDSGTWACGKSFVVSWKSGWVDHITMSADGNSLAIKNSAGMSLSASRK